MKKVKSSKIPKTVEEYFAAVPEPGRGTLQKVRAIIRSVPPPEATETVSSQMPAFRYQGALVCYAAFSNHCSFIPMDASLIVKHNRELKPYRAAKGTIQQFPLDKRW
jgi:uncharacterized protein YdhG (YjbR/CyaY superfamily)